MGKSPWKSKEREEKWVKKKSGRNMMLSKAFENGWEV